MSQEADFIISNFAFASGETLPELRQHYLTLGTPRRDSAGRIVNAVLLLHNTTGSAKEWLAPGLGGELFGPGQPLDAAHWFLVMPDCIGFGGSSKPSNGLRARFPRYRYHDMVAAQHRLLTEGLGIERLRLVLGLSMGGMLTWLWGGTSASIMSG
jgi:homoserine O-acetyltransferase/O-succinyltransferase